MNQRTRRSPARFLAPLALIAVLLAFVMVINNSGGSDSSNSADTTTDTSASTTKSAAKTTVTKAKRAVKKKAAQKTYTVQAGDSFNVIAGKTGITVEQLQELNPNADSGQLQVGQKLRVK